MTDQAEPLGVVIPTLNEEDALPLLLDDLERLPFPTRILVVDGGSRDRTREVARSRKVGLLPSPPGRARQMTAGAEHLDSPWLLFLHADCRLPLEAREALAGYLTEPGPEEAAHFRFRLDARGPWWRAIELGQRVREALTGLAYGDQGLLVSRERLDRLGGVPDLPFMEDVELVRRLRRTGGIRRLAVPIVTSPRRYREEGPFLGWLRNASLILVHSLGVPPRHLARWYRPRGAPRGPGEGGPPLRGDGDDPGTRILLVFAKVPEPGRVKTRLAGELGAEGAADLYRRMGRMVVDRVRAGPWRTVVCFDPPGGRREVLDWLGGDGDLECRPQEEGDLGARMEEAFAGAFAAAPGGAGEGPVVIVGTDAPGVEEGLVLEAFRALERRGGPDLVLGPATDGGYYLLGLRGPAARLFREIPWSTDRVLDLTLERARDMGLGWELLRPLSDVDRPEDLPATLLALPGRG